MKRVVLTGGPCSGKTTVLRALAEDFPGRIVLVPEAATLLLSGGFPVPGRHLPWSAQWQAAFQSAVLPLQLSLEEVHTLQARHVGASLLVCDRGLLDGAAYTPGGLAEFCRIFEIDPSAAFARYDAVLHLESLATADPTLYGRANNAERFEDLEEARRVEEALREAWQSHPRRILIEAGHGIEGKRNEVLGVVRDLLEQAGD